MPHNVWHACVTRDMRHCPILSCLLRLAGLWVDERRGRMDFVLLKIVIGFDNLLSKLLQTNYWLCHQSVGNIRRYTQRTLSFTCPFSHAIKAFTFASFFFISYYCQWQRWKLRVVMILQNRVFTIAAHLILTHFFQIANTRGVSII